MDALDVALAVANALDRAGVEYFLGGSLASSIQGDPRATNDIDFVVDLDIMKVASLTAALGADFSVDQDSLRIASVRRATCNVFYLPLLTKIDFFVLKRGAFDASEFARRMPTELRGQRLVVKTPEDSVLRKLLWYVEGGGTSERQWRDVVAILRVSGPFLDDAYLDAWALTLDLVALLAKARGEAR